MYGDDLDSGKDQETTPFIPKSDNNNQNDEKIALYEPKKTFFSQLATNLYGFIPPKDIPSIFWLASTLLIIIGSFWLLDSLKDTIFATMVGLDYQPKAKLLSVLFTFAVVCVYTYFLDRIEKPKLFSLIGIIYGFIFIILGVLISDPKIGIDNTEQNPFRLIAWMSYFCIESYGSVTVALFWAFTNSICDLDEAKSSYGLIIAMAQIGAFSGSTLATFVSKLSISVLFFIGGVGSLLIMPMITGYMYFFLKNKSALPFKKDSKSSFLEGVFFVIKYPYVSMILGISCLYEIVLTILDYEMKVLGRARYKNKLTATSEFAALMGHFGQAVNILAFAMSLFGTSFIVRKLGLPLTLRVFPCLLVITVMTLMFYPNLWILFVSISILKGLAYALNDPAKEMLYIPTSNDIKFKAKAWIDVVGSRGAKALGSFITNIAKDDTNRLIAIASAPTLISSLLLLWISVVIGKTFKRLISEKIIVGENENEANVSLIEEMTEATNRLLEDASRPRLGSEVELVTIGTYLPNNAKKLFNRIQNFTRVNLEPDKKDEDTELSI